VPGRDVTLTLNCWDEGEKGVQESAHRDKKKKGMKKEKSVAGRTKAIPETSGGDKIEKRLFPTRKGQRQNLSKVEQSHGAGDSLGSREGGRGTTRSG